MCQICNDMQRLTKNPDYRCKKCAVRMAYDAMIFPLMPDFMVRSRRYIESYAYPTYGRPFWTNRLGQKPPSVKDLNELRRTTWLEF